MLREADFRVNFAGDFFFGCDIDVSPAATAVHRAGVAVPVAVQECQKIEFEGGMADGVGEDRFPALHRHVHRGTEFGGDRA